MKNFLSNNWKRILILITIIFIVINIIHKCVAPHILVSEYAKYGPDVQKVEFSLTDNKVVNEIKESAPEGVSEDLLKLGGVLAVGLLAAVIISEMVNKHSKPAKKK